MFRAYTTNSVKIASLITAVSRYSVVVFNLVFTMALARLITPDEFGIIAIATVFTSFFSILSDMGLSSGVIQNKELSERDINNIYSFNCYISLGLAAVFFLFSFFLVWFYENPIYLPLGTLLATALLFSSMTAIPQALFMKKKRFALTGVTRVIASLCGGVVAIVLGFYNFGCFAIGFQSLITAVIPFIWLYLQARHEYGLRFNLIPGFASIRKILNYSAYIYGFNTINYFARNLDNLLIGKVFGAQALGYYDKAYKLTVFPVNNLTLVISSALHPILSEYQKNGQLVYERYIPIVKFLSLSGVFLSVIFVFAGNELIPLMFGGDWTESIIPFEVLSLSLWFQMTASSCGSIYLSLGKTRVSFQSCCIFVPVQVLCIVAGIYSGSLIWCSAFVSASFVAKFFVEYWFLIKKCFGQKYLKFLSLFLPDLFIALVMSIAMIIVVQTNILPNNIVFGLMVKLGISLAVFFACLVLTRQMKFLIMLLPKGFQARFSCVTSRESKPK